MAVDPTKLAMGPGTLYVGAFGATEPADTAMAIGIAPASPDWTDCGGTLGGLTFTVSQTFKELEVDQIVETPERRVTKREASLKTQLAEVSFDNLTVALASGTVVVGAGGVPDTYVPSNVNSGDSPTYKALIFDGYGGQGKRRRVIVRKVLSTDNVDMVSSKDGQTAYGVTFMSHYVSSVIPSYKIVQAK